eukprot:2381072-Amphidinium_carterae.1
MLADGVQSHKVQFLGPLQGLMEVGRRRCRTDSLVHKCAWLVDLGLHRVQRLTLHLGVVRVTGPCGRNARDFEDAVRNHIDSFDWFLESGLEEIVDDVLPLEQQ